MPQCSSFLLIFQNINQLALSMFGYVEIPTAMFEADNVASMFCKDETLFEPLCASFLFAFVGENAEQFNGVWV